MPSSFQSQVLRFVCVCELANVRDLQDRAPYVSQSYFGTSRCEVLMSLRDGQCQNTLSNRSSHHISSSLPCPCDIAPTWHQKQMDDSMSWDLDGLSTLCSRFRLHPKEDLEEHSNLRHSVDSLKTLQLHDAIGRHDYVFQGTLSLEICYALEIVYKKTSKNTNTWF